MRGLILGASGQIGSALLSHLTAAMPHAEWVGTSRAGKSPEKLQGPSSGIIQFDPFVDRFESLGPFDVIVNAIGQIRESRGSSFQKVHVGLAELLIAHHTTLGSPHIVNISALGAGQHPDLPFLASKDRADQLLQTHLKSVSILRPSIVCSPKTMVVQRLRMLLSLAKTSLGRLPVPKGFIQTHIQPILLTDLTQTVHKLVLEEKPEHKVIEAVGPQPISFDKLLRWGAEAQNLKLRYLEIPKPIIAPSVKYFVSPMMPGIMSYEQFQLLFRDNVGSISTLSKILERTPFSTELFWKHELGVG